MIAGLGFGLPVVVVAGLLTAGFGATPTPTAIPTPESETVWVPIDDSDPYASLQEAVDSVPPGLTIHPHRACRGRDRPAGRPAGDQWLLPWRSVNFEWSIGRCVDLVDAVEYEGLMTRKAELPKTRFGDGYDPEHVEPINRPTRRY